MDSGSERDPHSVHDGRSGDGWDRRRSAGSHGDQRGHRSASDHDELRARRHHSSEAAGEGRGALREGRRVSATTDASQSDQRSRSAEVHGARTGARASRWSQAHDGAPPGEGGEALRANGDRVNGAHRRDSAQHAHGQGSDGADVQQPPPTPTVRTLLHSAAWPQRSACTPAYTGRSARVAITSHDPPRLQNWRAEKRPEQRARLNDKDKSRARRMFGALQGHLAGGECALFPLRQLPPVVQKSRGSSAVRCG